MSATYFSLCPCVLHTHPVLPSSVLWFLHLPLSVLTSSLLFSFLSRLEGFESLASGCREPSHSFVCDRKGFGREGWSEGGWTHCQPSMLTTQILISNRGMVNIFIKCACEGYLAQGCFQYLHRPFYASVQFTRMCVFFYYFFYFPYETIRAFHFFLFISDEVGRFPDSWKWDLQCFFFFFFSSSFCLRAFSTAPGQKKKKTKNKNTLNPPPESGGNSGAIRSRCRTQNVTSSPGEFVHGGSLRVKDRAKKLWSGPTFKRR